MKNTINNTNPVRAMMKPLPVSESKADLRRQQEDHVFGYLSQAGLSVCAADVADNCPNIPGHTYRGGGPSTRFVSHILRRLEAKGRIISTLYSGRRYYSTFVGGEQ